MSSKSNIELEANDISLEPLKLLRVVRLHPALNSKFTTALVFLPVMLCILFLVLAVKGVLISYDTDIFFMSECLQTCILMSHICGKLLTLHFQKPVLTKLLLNKTKFWKIGIETEQYADAKMFKTVNIAKKIMRPFFLLFVFATLFFDIQPLTTGFLPTGCYVPDGWFNCLTVLLWYLSCVAALTVVGTDCLFASLIAPLIVQFKLLANRFRKMPFLHSEQKIWSFLEELVDYHNFLLNYCEELNSVFRPVFLLQFLMSIASSSVSVFIFMQPGDWTNRIKFLLYFLAIMAETGFYCIPVEIIMNTSSEIDEAVYDSRWYEIKNSQLRKSLTQIIIRSQKTLIFSGYGLININLGTFVLVCKTVFTFYTYLNSARKLAVK